MKLIIAFALIVAVSCDVSHIIEQGDGWFKDASGYHYNKPESRFTEEVAVEVVAADVPAVEEAVVVVEPEAVVADEVVEQVIGSDEPVLVEVPLQTPVEEAVVADEPAPVEVAAVEEVVADEPAPVEVAEVVPEVKVNNEYLPPVVTAADAKKKRQIPVRRVVRKVYRRFVPVKRH
ncbi:uncharacterized protein [Chironomus tepperi]|uniref:uncharacterized protein n=1 Tax=Chironomus tepperi TaxID=113505 RepID=UPI00391F6D1D